MERRRRALAGGYSPLERRVIFFEKYLGQSSRIWGFWIYSRGKRGFTLVELLVVVSIILMVASALFIQLQAYRGRARDAERERTVKELQKALELYVTNRLVFPQWSGVITGSDVLSLALIDADAIPSVRPDPLNSGTYVYSYDSPTGETYVITYNLETDSIAGKHKGLQKVTP